LALSATILGLEGPILEAEEALFFNIAQPWGFILFARNIESPAQLRRLTSDLREAVGRDAPILIDQEGGRVQRMRAPHWREWLPPLDQMARSWGARRG
jgi:beta-N-acetylhexosaminidase